MDWNDESCVVWISYKHSSGDESDIPDSEMTSARRNVKDVQVKRFIRFVHVKFNAFL